MLNLEELEQLLAFKELGTLSKVAEKFLISTPSLSRSMQHFLIVASIAFHSMKQVNEQLRLRKEF